MARISKTERLLNLVSYLLKERRPVPWRDIVGRVVGYDDGSDPKSLERRFERDKAALKEMGIPIQYLPPGVAEAEGYMIPREAAFLDEAELSPREVSLLNLISAMALRERSADRAELVSALRKLSFDVDLEAIAERPAPEARRGARGRRRRGAAQPGAGAQTSDPWRAAVLQLDLVGALRAERQLPALVAALHANQAVRFSYHALHNDRTSERTVEPYGLGYARGAWYLVGRDRDRDAIRTFNLRRLRSAVSTVGPPGAFTVPETFRLDDYLERPAWEYSDAAPQRVEIEVGPDIGWFLEGPIAKHSFEMRPDGSVRMAFEIRNREAFINWILPKLRHVRIVAPASLRAQLRETLDRLIERHARAAVSPAGSAGSRP
ncbi:MAG: WYL domain-containing transcriptional regulator [Planctomycetota bacterium]|nr:MAG: WYL domain-containing transcriptional regulator [Planctomycetota bacterium]